MFISGHFVDYPQERFGHMQFPCHSIPQINKNLLSLFVQADKRMALIRQITVAVCTGRGKSCLQSLFVPNSHIKAMSLLQNEWGKILSCPSLKFTPDFPHLISILWLNIIPLNIVLLT